MKKVSFFLLFAAFAINVNGQKPFITVWKTDNEGASASNQIKFPGRGSSKESYKIEWEEKGNPSNKGVFNLSGSYKILTFPKPGIYILKTTTPIGVTFSQDFFEEADFNVGEWKKMPCDNKKLLEVQQWGDINWSNMRKAFKGCENLDVTAIDAPILLNGASMESMFNGCTNLIGTTSFSNWDVKHVTSMYHTFGDCKKFNQPIGSWDVSNVTGFDNMFQNATSFNQPLNNWNVSNAKNFWYMFENATSFNQDLSNWKFTNANFLVGMFKGATSFNQPLNSWDISNVSSIKEMFRGATSFNQDLSSWQSKNNVTNDGIFDGATSYTFSKKVPSFAVDNQLEPYKSILEKNSLDIQNKPFVTVWKTDNYSTAGTDNDEIAFPFSAKEYRVDWYEVGNEKNKGSEKIKETSRVLRFKKTGTYVVAAYANNKYEFNFEPVSIKNHHKGIDNFKLLFIVQWGDVKWGKLDYAFANCENMDMIAKDAPNLNEYLWYLDGMFLNCTSLVANPSINDWRVSKVKGASKMFYNCPKFNQPLNKWYVINLSNMSYMFANCTNFNQSINDWPIDASSGNTSYMFENCINFNQPFDKWVEGSLDLVNTSFMFKGCSKFNQSLNNWQPGGLFHTDGMFQDCISYNQPMNNWAAKVKQLETSNYMFKGAKSFNQDIGNWNFEYVKDKSLSNRKGMFEDATSFSYLVPWLSPKDEVNMDVFKGATTYIDNYEKIKKQHLFKKEKFTDADLSTKAFITKWSTTKGGNQFYDFIFLPVRAPYIHVHWQDADNSKIMGDTMFYNLKKENYSNYTNQINFPKPGNYIVNVKVPKQVDATIYNAFKDNFTLVDVMQWGDIVWENLTGAFSNCYSLDVTAKDAPNLSKAKDLSKMFYNCRSLIGTTSFNNWNTFYVTKTNEMFSGCVSFNQPLGNWQVFRLEELISMFENATSFNQDLRMWELSSVRECYYVFAGATAYRGKNFKRVSAKEQAIKDFVEQKKFEQEKIAKSLDECNLYLKGHLKSIQEGYAKWKTATENEFKYSIKNGSVSRSTSELIGLMQKMRETVGLGVCNGLGVEQQNKLRDILQKRIDSFREFGNEYDKANKKPSIWEALIMGLQIATGTLE